MNKIKIAFIINYIKKSGPSSVLMNIVDCISKEKYDITVITLFEGNDEKILNSLRNNNINVVEKNYKSRIKFMFRGQKEFLKRFRLLNFDIVHTHGFIPDCVFSKLKGLTKKISTVHCNLFEDYKEQYGKIRGYIYAWMHIFSLNRYDMVVCCSKSVKLALRKYIKKAQYILNGVSIEKSNIKVNRHELSIPEDAVVFIYAGGLTKRKNVLFLVDEFVKYHNKNEFLLILGEGNLYEQCKAKSDSNVRFLGFKQNPSNYFKLSDFYISASKSEGLSISLIEAMSYGLGLFLSDIPSHSEMINLCSSIYIGEFFDKNNFNKKLQILRNNMYKINRENIRKLQRSKLSAKSMSAQYEKVYTEMLGENNGKSKCHNSGL